MQRARGVGSRREGSASGQTIPLPSVLAESLSLAATVAGNVAMCVTAALTVYHTGKLSPRLQPWLQLGWL